MNSVLLNCIRRDWLRNVNWKTVLRRIKISVQKLPVRKLSNSDLRIGVLPMEGIWSCPVRSCDSWNSLRIREYRLPETRLEIGRPHVVRTFWASSRPCGLLHTSKDSWVRALSSGASPAAITTRWRWTKSSEPSGRTRKPYPRCGSYL